MVTNIVKKLMIANGIIYALTLLLAHIGIDLVSIFGLFHPTSDNYHFYQIFTHMFMHDPDSFGHIIMNMFSLWMFGRVLEQVWGSKRFLIYYFITGLGAVALYLAVQSFELSSINRLIAGFESTPSADQFEMLIMSKIRPSDQLLSFIDLFHNSPNDPQMISQATMILKKVMLGQIVDVPVIGASGAVYGVLFAFGMLFPNTVLHLYFAIPVKAKFLVAGLIAIELFQGLFNGGSNIAHFAHLGGMLFGFFILKYWGSRGKKFY